MSSSTLPMAPSLADSEKLFLIEAIVAEAADAAVASLRRPLPRPGHDDDRAAIPPGPARSVLAALQAPASAGARLPGALDACAAGSVCIRVRGIH
jgi:hypothetical protein